MSQSQQPDNLTPDAENTPKDNEDQATSAMPEENSAKQSTQKTEEEYAKPMQAEGEKSENSQPEKNQQGKMPAILEAEAGAWSSLFNGLAKGGPLFLLLALFLMAWHDFYKPDNAVYCPAEFKAITAFLHCIAQGSWLTPTGLDANAWTLAQWPGFYWFTGLFALIPSLDTSSLLLPVVEYCACALALIGIWWLAHSAGFGLRAAFAAGVMAIACPIFAPLPHFMGAAALAAAFFLFALLFFYKGWTKEHAFISLPLAFIFTTCAGLTGGLLLFAVPLISSVCFLIWRGSFKRGQRLDALIGFLIMLAIIGAWLGCIMLGKGDSQYLRLLAEDSIALAWPLRSLWWAALGAGFLGTLPWLLTIFGVSWFGVLKNAGATFSASRHDNGSAMIWISLVLTAGLGIWIPQFHIVAVATASLALILFGKAFIHMPPAGNRFFFCLASLLTLCVGLLLFALHFESTQSFILEHIKAPIPDLARHTLISLPTLPIIAGILAIGGICGFYFVKKNRHSGGLLYALLIAVILCQPARLILVPELASNPALPVRTYDFIRGEVENALSHTPAREESGSQYQLSPAGSGATQPSAKTDGNVVAPQQGTATGSANVKSETGETQTVPTGPDLKTPPIYEPQTSPAPEPSEPVAPQAYPAEVNSGSDANLPSIQEKMHQQLEKTMELPAASPQPEIIEKETIIKEIMPEAKVPDAPSSQESAQ